LRDIISLNGIWALSLDKKFSPNNTYVVNVPGCLGNQIPALKDYRGSVWYKKDFEITNKPLRKSSFLIQFNAVNYLAEIWLNGDFIGSHEGGYTPFYFDVTKHIKKKNELLVKVLIPGNNDPNFPFPEIPHGKQETQWYGIAGGIWQDVKLLVTGSTYIKRIFLNPDAENNKVSIRIESKLDDSKEPYRLILTIYDPMGKECGNQVLELEPLMETEISVSNPLLWDINNPYLYSIRAVIKDKKDNVLDEVTEHFGFRKIEVKDKEILLNGKPIYLMGALDQDFYSDSHYTPPSEEFVRDQLILAKEMGLNCLRYHLKVPHPWYLKWADRVGILIWYDMPNWSKSTPEAKLRGEKLLEEMVNYDYNHPSVIIRTIINEGWGLDLVNSEEDRKWLEKMYDKLKRLDPTRLVVDNSPCFPNFHVKTDIDDFHNYFAFPDKFRNMQTWISEFAKSPNWSFHINSKKRGNEPLVLSEFGNWGLPNIKKLRAQYGGEPWWFLQGDPITATQPLGVEERFWQFGLNKVFDSIENLSEAFQDLQFQALKFQIEEIRKHPEIKGYIITEFTDLYWECNGLLDITRGKKAHFEELKNLNSLDLIFPQERLNAVWSGDEINIPILFSHLSDIPLDELKFSWQLEGTDLKVSKTIDKVKSGLNHIDVITFKVPDISEPGIYRINLKLTSKKQVINENYIDLFVVPKDLLKGINLKLGIKDISLEDNLVSAILNSYKISEADVIYASSYDSTFPEIASEGKTVIIELSEDTEFSHFGYSLHRRTGIEEGNWISGLGIIHPQIAGKVFKNKILDYKFIDNIPSYVLLGEFNFNSKTLMGIVFGWIDHPLNFMVEIPMGKGKIILHTFPIIKNLSRSPIMTALLYQLLKSFERR
jgi:hypothetical protein